MSFADRQLNVGVIVATRGFFNDAFVAGAREDWQRVLEKAGVNCIMLPMDATPSGGVETLTDADICARFFRESRATIHGIIVTLPNFGDEIGVVEAIRRSGMSVPVLVHAYPDDRGNLSVSGRRDSFCGKISVCNNLRQYGIPFSLTRSHVADPSGPAFARDIEHFVSVCRTVFGLRNARIGAIGARTAPFQTMRFSEKLLQQTGINVVPVDLSEIIDRANKIGDDDSVLTDKLASIRDYGRIAAQIRNEQILRQARFSVAVEQWIEQNECDASCIQCWSSLQENFGCASCLSMSMMGEALAPSACEVDVMGAVSMYALTLAGGVPSALLDWNNNVGDDPDLCAAVHCGNYPKGFMGETPELGELDVIGETLGKDKCFGAVKGRVQPGEFTYLRASSDDIVGRIRFYTGEGQFTDDEFGIDGGVAICRIAGLQGLMQMICREGFEHHVAMSRGRTASILGESLATYLKWDAVRV